MRQWTKIAWIGWVVSLTACDSSGLDVNGPYSEVLDSVCDTLDRCPDALGRPIVYRSHDECRSILHWALSCRLTSEEVGDTRTYGVEERVPTVDEDGAAACRAWLAETSCDDLFRDDVNPCSDVFTLDDTSTDDGGGAEGEGCDRDDDCQSSLRCTEGAYDAARNLSLCQVCAPRAAEGEPCRQLTRDCPDDLYCGLGADGSRVCLQLSDVGGECDSDAQCASGFCDGTVPSPRGYGTCGMGGREGDACASAGCRAELYCDGAVCRPRVDNGEPCTDDEQCRNRSCSIEMGRCGSPDGEGCSSGSQCASGGCNGGVCGPPQPGGDCYTDDECVATERCRDDLGRCAPPGGDGAECRRDEECTSGYCTSDDRCGSPPQSGASCSDLSDCDPRQHCAGGTCVDRARPGEACGALDSCLEPFLCQEGTCQLINLACEPAHEGQGCAFLRVCDADTYCDLLGGVVCRRRGGEGETCSPTPIRGVEVCRDGLGCAPDATTGEYSCVRRPSIGEACDVSLGCAEGACFEGVCAAPPAGQACDDYDAPCPDGFACSRRLDVCVPRGGEGAECYETTDCQPELYCDSSRCAPRLALGTSCYDNEECRPELYCDRSTGCATRIPAGGDCSPSDGMCADGSVCEYDSASTASPPYRCTALRAAGEACSSDSECASQSCHDSSVCAASAMCAPPA